MSTLSVIIITKNEEKNIHGCLESVKFADEIIILDSGSTDNTVNLCQKYTSRIYSVDWPGFGPQKNRALEKCQSQWVLSVDADEIVTPALQAEIKKVIAQASPYVAYTLPRQSTYCQKLIKFGDWRNDRSLRLFLRGFAQFKPLPVHEALEVNGSIGHLTHYLLHHSFTTMDQVLHKMNEYSTLSAIHKFKQGKKSGLFKAILHGSWTFFRGYILKLGFLDGRRGFLLAVSNAEGCYYRYVKIMLLSSKG